VRATPLYLNSSAMGSVLFLALPTGGHRMSNTKTILKTIPLVLLTFFAVSCARTTGTPLPTTTVPQPAMITTIPPATPSPPTTTLPATGPSTPSPTITYDFDTGLPALLRGQSTPFAQTSGSMTAHFSSPSDPAAFSIQSYETTFYKLSQFSGNYLNDNKPFRNALHIRFSQQVTSITLTFATTDYHGVGEVDEPTAIKLTAYINTTETTPVGSVTSRGTFPINYSFPQGTLSFNSGGEPFNLVVIELLVQPRGAVYFLVDEITVMPSGRANAGQ